MDMIDTLPANAQAVADKLNLVTTAMTIMLHPAFIAIIVNTALTWALDAFDRFLPPAFWKKGTQEIAHPIRFVLAAVGTIPCMWAAMFLMKLPFRGENAGYALMSGFVALAINELLLKKIGLDVDKWCGDEDAPAPPPAA